jgi:hypothetical protein
MWRYSALVIVFGIIAVSFFNATMAVDLVRSFINGESNIGFWMVHGWSFKKSIAIAIACSTWDIFSWFALFNALKGLYQRAKPIYDALVAGHEIEQLNGRADWIRRLCRIGLKIYLFCVPQPSDRFEASGSHRSFRYYLPLLFYGFAPSCIWTGVGYSFSFQLSPFLAFFVVSFANSLKMVAFGYLAFFVGPWVVAVSVTSIPVVRWVIERHHRAS